MDVVILCGSSGSRLFPLTIGQPKALLPVANKPILSYLLASLERCGFREVLLITTEEFQRPIKEFQETYVADGIGKLKLGLEVNSDSVGTGEALRLLKRKGVIGNSCNSVLVLPGEAIVEEQLLDLLDLHERHDSDLTMLLVEEPKIVLPAHSSSKTPLKPKKQDEEDIEYVGLVSDGCGTTNSSSATTSFRLLLKTPALAVEETLSVPKMLLARSALAGHGSSLKLRADLSDPHVYVMSSWVLDLLEASKPPPSMTDENNDENSDGASSDSESSNPGRGMALEGGNVLGKGDLSIKNDLVPYLIRRQMHSPSESGMLPSTLKPRGLASISSCAPFSSSSSSMSSSSTPSLSIASTSAPPSPPKSPGNAPPSPGDHGSGGGNDSGDNTARLSVLDGRDRRVARRELAMLSSGNTQQRRREGLGSVIEQPQSSFKSPSPWTDSVALLEICRCFAHVVQGPTRKPATPDALFVARGDTIASYLEMNRRVVSWSAGQGAARYIFDGDEDFAIESQTATTMTKERMGLLNQGERIEGIQANGVVKDPTVVVEGKKATTRQSVLGAGVVLGQGSKLNDCVVMDRAKIGAGATLQDCVVCSGASVGDNCVLKNCQVAANFSVPKDTKGEDESFSGGASGGSSDTGDSDW